MIFTWQWEVEMVLRLILALVLSGIIGMERESLNKFAGFRTHILVGIGACLVMIISLSMPFIQYPGTPPEGFRTDSARIAAQIVSGIGFLGAGAIMSSGVTVKGLTTAASLWAVAGIGMAAGSGLYIIATASTILTYMTLSLFFHVEERFQAHKYMVNMRLTMLDEACAVGKLFDMFNELSVKVKNTTILEDTQIGRDTITLELMLRLPARFNIVELISKLDKMPDIYDIEYKL